MRQRLSVILAVSIAAVLSSCNNATSPNCATVDGTFNPAYADIFVFYHTGVNAVATTDSLSSRYGFTPITVDTAVASFTMPAPQPASVLNGVRCEPSVWLIGYDGPTQPI